MGKKAPIDKALDRYAAEYINNSEEYRWWWNADGVLAAAIASAARHIRKDGCHLLTKKERKELKTLERYMRAWASNDIPLTTTVGEDEWLHAEAMWLFGQWFSRLWD